MEFDKYEDGAFWVRNESFESEQTVEGLVDWFPIADEFPELVWCLFYPERGTYTCQAVPGEIDTYGLVTFTSLEIAELFKQAMGEHKPALSDCMPALRTFDEARQLAKERDKIHALILMDDPLNPRVHYVKALHE